MAEYPDAQVAQLFRMFKASVRSTRAEYQRAERVSAQGEPINLPAQRELRDNIIHGATQAYRASLWVVENAYRMETEREGKPVKTAIDLADKYIAAVNAGTEE